MCYQNKNRTVFFYKVFHIDSFVHKYMIYYVLKNEIIFKTEVKIDVGYSKKNIRDRNLILFSFFFWLIMMGNMRIYSVFSGIR